MSAWLAGGVLAAAGWAACAGAQVKSDWEEKEEARNWKEIEAPLPAYPRDSDLIEFHVSNVATFRFFIDRASLSIGSDGVARYTLVARSPNGFDNVTFEGIRCKGGLYRIYATGRSNRTWSPRIASEWKEIQPKTVQRWHQALRREYFCPQNTIVFDAAEGINALLLGGHPNKGHTSYD